MVPPGVEEPVTAVSAEQISGESVGVPEAGDEPAQEDSDDEVPQALAPSGSLIRPSGSLIRPSGSLIRPASSQNFGQLPRFAEFPDEESSGAGEDGGSEFLANPVPSLGMQPVAAPRSLGIRPRRSSAGDSFAMFAQNLRESTDRAGSDGAD
jgi:hypothetical protein